MRTRSKLFYGFLALLLIVASVVGAARGGKKRRNKKKGKGKKPALTAPSGSDGGTLVERNSGPRLESGRGRDNKAGVEGAFSIVEGDRSEIVASAISGCGAERDDALGKEFWGAVNGGNFGWLRANGEIGGS